MITTSKPVVQTAVPSVVENSTALPEGFFDNPQMDARVRKVEYVDKMEVEWDTFTREMKQEANVKNNFNHCQSLVFFSFQRN